MMRGAQKRKRSASTCRSLLKLQLALVILLIPAVLFARPKTDSVELANGNVLTVEILSMSRAYLSLSTDSMSTIAVKWPDVKRITSTYGFVVEDSAGRRFYGPLSCPDQGVLLMVDIRTGSHSVPLTSIVSIYPSYRSLWSRFDGSLDGGYSYTKSQSRTEFNLSTEIRYRSIRWESKLNADSLISISNGDLETGRHTIGLTEIRHLGSRWHWFLQAQYQHNEELDLSFRNTVLSGMARAIVQSNRSTLTVLGAFAYSREKYSDTDSFNNSAAGLGAEYQFFKLYTPKMDISALFLVIPSFTTGGRVRTELEIKSRIEIIKDFFWSLSFYDSYDSKPPGEDTQNQDYGITTGIGWTFG